MASDFFQRPNPSPLVGYHQSSIERIQLQPFPHLPPVVLGQLVDRNGLPFHLPRVSASLDVFGLTHPIPLVAYPPKKTWFRLV